MAMPGMPAPADTLKEVSKELQEKFDEAGMGSVESFVDKIEEIKEKAAAGPGDAMDAVKGKFDEFKGKMEEIISNPSALAPAGLAPVAVWYGNAVAAKLIAFKEEVEGILKSLLQTAADIMDPMKSLGDTLGTVMAELEKTLKKLAKLPKEVGKMAAEIDSPDDIAKIDVDSMKACLDVSGIDSPLGNLGGLGATLGGAIEKVKQGITLIEEFIQNAADNLKLCFQVPAPLCFVTPCAMQNAPQPLQDLLACVDNLKTVDLSSLVGMLSNTMDTLGQMDVEKVKTPVNAFATAAAEPVGKLEKAVQGAKLASGDGHPAIPKMF